MSDRLAVHRRPQAAALLQKEDVEEAIRLIKVATQQAATDPVTGKIDMDMIKIIFLSGFLFHLVFEYTGINFWYSVNYPRS